MTPTPGSARIRAKPPGTGPNTTTFWALGHVARLVVVAAVIVSGCASGTQRESATTERTPTTVRTTTTATTTTTTTVPARIDDAALTTDGAGTYDFGVVDDTITVTVPEGVGGLGVREVFWRAGSPVTVDQDACITWNDIAFGEDRPDPVQPGLALRIAPAADPYGATRAITVNQNVWSTASWYVWVNTWDTARVGGVNEPAATFDVSGVVGRRWADENGWYSSVVEAPWHVCARVRGLQLTFKLWTHAETEPAWDDPTHVFATTLPEGWDHAGHTGGYIGHLGAGGSATFDVPTSAAGCPGGSTGPDGTCAAPTTTRGPAGTASTPSGTEPGAPGDTGG